MRSSKVLLCAMMVTACAGAEGDVLRSTPDAATSEASTLDAPTLDAATSDAATSDAATSDAPTLDGRLPGDAAPPHPKPEPLMTWQIQLSGGMVDTSAEARVYIADFEMPASVIRTLHSAGRIVICYFSAGTREDFRTDAPDFPTSSLGASLPNYPNERWVDIRNPTVRSIMQDRVAKAARSDCDGVHPSGLAAFLTNTGFDFTRADQLAYDRLLTAAAHTLGLSIGLVDGDVSLRQDLVADFDWTIVFGCLATNCTPAGPFVAARKAAFLVEYGDESRKAEVCPKAKDLGLSAIIKRDANLDAFRATCL
ncbi:MAG TPA: endo alpha-1,4 polygalactosaminidase [Polyangiaceae bacterium]|nr:endo alpha-1,4 polygalactosaminidase [Polyangiaceae bacterium]